MHMHFWARTGPKHLGYYHLLCYRVTYFLHNPPKQCHFTQHKQFNRNDVKQKSNLKTEIVLGVFAR